MKLKIKKTLFGILGVSLVLGTLASIAVACRNNGSKAQNPKPTPKPKPSPGTTEVDFNQLNTKVTVQYKDANNTLFKDALFDADKYLFNTNDDTVSVLFISASKDSTNTKIVVTYQLMKGDKKSNNFTKEILASSFKQEEVKKYPTKANIITVHDKTKNGASISVTLDYQVEKNATVKVKITNLNQVIEQKITNSSNIVTFKLEGLQQNVEYKVESLTVIDAETRDIDVSAIKNSVISVEDSKEKKDAKNEIQDIMLLSRTETSLELKFIFKDEIDNDATISFKINEFKTPYTFKTTKKGNEFTYNINGLSENTNYRISSLTVNGKEVDLARVKDKEFQTVDPSQAIKDPKPTKVVVSSKTATTLQLTISFDKEIEKGKKVIVKLVGVNPEVSETLTANTNTVTLDFTNLTKGTKYKIESIKIGDTILDLDAVKDTELMTDESKKVDPPKVDEEPKITKLELDESSKTANSFTLKLTFDKEVKKGTKIKIELDKEDKSVEKTLDIDSKEISFDFKGLTAKTTYKVKNITLGDKTLDINAIKNQELITKEDKKVNPPNPGAEPMVTGITIAESSRTTESFTLKVAFNKKLKIGTRIKVELDKDNKLVEVTIDKETNEVAVMFSGLMKNTMYRVIKVSLDGKQLNLSTLTNSNFETADDEGITKLKAKVTKAELTSSTYNSFTLKVTFDKELPDNTHLTFKLINNEELKIVQVTKASNEVNVTFQRLEPKTKYKIEFISNNNNNLDISAIKDQEFETPDVTEASRVEKLEVKDSSPIGIVLGITFDHEIKAGLKIYFKLKDKEDLIESPVDTSGKEIEVVLSHLEPNKKYIIEKILVESKEINFDNFKTSPELMTKPQLNQRS
ncbi:DUF1410 domain-containing protein [Ureaplasma canigenitalium]|uniref:DUF1410 domain-containing protein n=1 Tax=Ureaplasma canigenitalium TaxID=42092 RepID=UPI0004E1FAF2|nr:DUF1410 domain-containing protein [Ureaplasma canigenitalium]